MEIINTIFGNYGGERLVRVLKAYWILSLFIKQLIFSFFLFPADQQPVAAVAREINTAAAAEGSVVDAEPRADTESLEFLRLMSVLAMLDVE